MPELPKQATRKPKLVNRGPAGLLTKIKPVNKPAMSQHVNSETVIDRISPDLEGLTVDITTLVLDPNNARLHPERNLEAIKESLKAYGQVKPVVVRRETNTVIAGNGTLEAARALGWTKIAANFTDMNEVEAAGYGLADNRTAELAKWDFEVVARLDKLLQEAGQASIGWSLDELEVLRAADWVPPPIEEGGFGRESEEAESLLVSFTPDEYQSVGEAIRLIREQAGKPGMGQASCLIEICKQWLGVQESEPQELLETE